VIEQLKDESDSIELIDYSYFYREINCTLSQAGIRFVKKTNRNKSPAVEAHASHAARTAAM
jgi:hypothetical protein